MLNPISKVILLTSDVVCTGLVGNMFECIAQINKIGQYLTVVYPEAVGAICTDERAVF